MTTDEIAQTFQIRRLTKEEIIKSFDCGDDDLNDFILNESQLYRKARLAVSYVIERKESDKVVGFFSLANDRVSVSDFNQRQNLTDSERKNLSMISA